MQTQSCASSSPFYNSQGGEDLSSDFHNDLYQFSMETRRWYAAEMRPPKKDKGQEKEEDKEEEAAASASAGEGQRQLFWNCRWAQGQRRGGGGVFC